MTGFAGRRQRWPGGAALAGRVLALAAGLAVLAAALLFLRLSIDHFWHVVAPIYRNHGTGGRLDFTWFFYGMQTAWLHADPARRLYDIAAQDAWMRAQHFPYDHSDLFGYPPPFALIWAPLARLPYLRARTLWTQINIAALGVGLAAAAWHASPRFGLARWLVLGGAGLWAWALQSNYYWGQPDALTFGLVALGLLAVCRPRPGMLAAVLGGVAIGLAADFKLTPAAVLAYLTVRWFLARRTERGRAAGAGALAGWATVGVTSAASGAVLGWSTLTTYLRQTVPAVERSAWAHGAAPWNQGLRGVLMIWSHNAKLMNHEAMLFGAGVFALAVFAAALRPGLDHRLEAALAALLVLLPSPSLEDHHFTVAILPWILLGGYLLDRVADWRKAWLWPLAAVFAVASLIMVAPARLRWPPPLPGGPGRVVRVPAGRYSQVYMLGAASYGPVRWTLKLQYRGAAGGSAQADWPDWWSPNDPLPPVIAGEAETRGSVQNAHVGIYGYGYPARPEATLVALRLPTALPRQNGGPEALHVVAVTLQRAAGGFVHVSLPYNVHGLAPSARYSTRTALTFDGNGNVFWAPDWPGGSVRAEIGGVAVPFALASRTAGVNVLTAPAPAGALATGRLAVLFSRAPNFVMLCLLFGVAVLAAGVERPTGTPAAA